MTRTNTNAGKAGQVLPPAPYKLTPADADTLAWMACVVMDTDGVADSVDVTRVWSDFVDWHAGTFSGEWRFTVKAVNDTEFAVVVTGKAGYSGDGYNEPRESFFDPQLVSVYARRGGSYARVPDGRAAQVLELVRADALDAIRTDLLNY